MSCELHCLKISNLSVFAGGKEIVHNVSLHAHCGELTAIIGKNGSGKSTLLKGLLGELPCSGEISFSGHDRLNIRNSVPRIGYVPQYHSRDDNSPTTVFDLIHTFNSKYPVFLPRRKKDIENVRNQLKLFGVEYLIEELVGNLSGGEFQRVLLANAMISKPDLLILDEPVSGVDESGLNSFFKSLRDMKKTHDIIILLVSHDLNFVYENAEKVILMVDGHEISGSPDIVFSSKEFKSSFPGHI